jgi:hypothetical protein
VLRVTIDPDDINVFKTYNRISIVRGNGLSNEEDLGSGATNTRRLIVALAGTATLAVQNTAGLLDLNEPTRGLIIPKGIGFTVAQQSVDGVLAVFEEGDTLSAGR